MPAHRALPAVIAAAVILLSACGEVPSAPRSTAAPVVRTALLQGVRLVPNSVRYRSQAYAHATGRSGNASLTARALLDRAGTTTLEVTTGQLDQAGAPGSIKKVQVKLLDPDQLLQRTLNYNGLGAGGRFSRSYAARPWHSFLQVQANIEGIDPRTDVVTVSERVNLRPDLAVQAVHAPAQVRSGDAALISADVAELNGDVGATTECVLRIDGQVAERVPGVWVAEGDAVTCEFLRTFTDVGTHTLDVAAEQVVPGDWDTANNHAGATLVVGSREEPMNGYADFTGYHITFRIEQTYDWHSSSGDHGASQSQQIQYINGQNGHLQARAAAAMTPPLAAGSYVSIDAEEGPALAFDLAGLGPDPGDNCGRLLSFSDQVVVCFSSGGTLVLASHSSSRTTYFAHSLYDIWNAAGENYYHSESTSSGVQQQWGLAPDVGDQVTWRVHIADGQNSFGADPAVPLSSSYETRNSEDYSCNVQDDGYLWQQWCMRMPWLRRDYSGSVGF